MLRLFLAFRLPDESLARIHAWQTRALAGADVRRLSRDHLHVTAVFLGSLPASAVPVVTAVMAEAMSTARRPRFRTFGYRETARVGMITLREELVEGDRYVGRANALVGALMRALETRGLYTRERRSWMPHVTVSRFRQPPGLELAPPDLGVFAPVDLVLFESKLEPAGSTYVELSGRMFEG